MKIMTNYLIISTLLVFLYCCDGEKCHREISFVNNTQDTIILGSLLKDVYGNCVIAFRQNVNPKSQIVENYRHCLEAELSFKNLELYAVDPSLFNDQEEFYSCDSIEILNMILKKYSISLDQLKDDNFTVTYP